MWWVVLSVGGDFMFPVVCYYYVLVEFLSVCSWLCVILLVFCVAFVLCLCVLLNRVLFLLHNADSDQTILTPFVTRPLSWLVAVLVTAPVAYFFSCYSE